MSKVPISTVTSGVQK